MRIAANLGVLDEVSLIAPCIRNLQETGFTDIIVTDTGSTDGTQDILQEFASRGEIRLLTLDEETPANFSYIQAMLDYTLQEVKPDWLSFLDADEFYVLRDGSLENLLKDTTADVLHVSRLNVPPGPEGVYFSYDLLEQRKLEELLLITKPISNFYDHMREHPDTPWIMGRVVPKVIARAGRINKVANGGHGVSGDDVELKGISPDSQICMGHLPLTTLERFRGKLERIVATLEKHRNEFTGNEGWHWKRWADIYQRGLVEEEFAHMVFDEVRLKALMDQGIVQNVQAWFEG